MAIETKIAWTDSTFNPWIGCTKVGPGCVNCYAEAADRRFHGIKVESQAGKFGVEKGKHWGAGALRKRTSPSYWKAPLKWNKQAQKEIESGERLRWLVFCASQADVFDNEAPQDWRDELWALIEKTPYLTWQLVTKRIGNVLKMVPHAWAQNGFPENVWVLATIVNQDELDRDGAKLVEIPAVVTGVSYEPALGPVDWSNYLWREREIFGVAPRNGTWIIVGGESLQAGQARDFELKWAESTVEQCEDAGAPAFVKQLGSMPVDHGCNYIGSGEHQNNARYKWDDPAEWPKRLQRREFPTPGTRGIPRRKEKAAA